MVLFHLLDDEILDLYGAKIKYSKETLMAKLQEDLYLLLAILPIDEVVAISPTFLFENPLCEELIRNNIPLAENYFLVSLMKEHIIEDVYLKKQDRYKRVFDIPKYHDAYYGVRLKQVQDILLCQSDKVVSIGPASFSIFMNQLANHKEKSNIAPRIFQDILKRLQETERDSFLWESVIKQLKKADVPSKTIQALRFRETMSLSYLQAYQQNGVTLIHDPIICPSIKGSQGYDIRMIAILFSLMGIKTMLLSLDAKKFCELKQNNDFRKAMDRVRELLQTGQAIGDIMDKLETENINLKLQKILKQSCGIIQGERCPMTDVLIMLATSEEERAIISKGGWERKRLESKQEYYTCVKEGVSFSLARGYRMGESDAAIMAQKLIDRLNPKVIAMAGFCAGKSGRVQLGDLIVANKIYNYDIGKQISPNDVLPEINSNTLDGTWLQYIERLDFNWIDKIGLQAPADFQWQKNELLIALRNHESVTVEQVYDPQKYPNWGEIIDSLQEEDYILINGTDVELTLTEKGRSYIGEYLVKNIKNIAPEPHVYIGPIATGTKVQTWSHIFQFLETMHDRKTCALDMESHIIGTLANYNNLPFIVVKGVGDFADDGKAFANRFIEFTSFSSCKFIMNLFTADDFKPYWNRT